MKNVLVCLLFVVPVLLAGCGGGGSSIAKVPDVALQATPTAQEWVFYNAHSNSTGQIEIFQLKTTPNGTPQPTILTSGAGIDWLNPRLSPDHTKIVVTRYVKPVVGNPNTDIKTVVSFRVTAPSQITTIAGNAKTPCEDPAWSPDGKHIVYKETTSHNPYRGRIVEVDSSGQNPVTITSNPLFVQKARTTPLNQPGDEVDYECSVPSYSRNDNGRRIALQCFMPDSKGSSTTHEQILVVDCKTKVPTQITSGTVKHWYPAWNPLANQVTYILNELGKGAKLHRVDVSTMADSLVAVPYQQGINAKTELVDPAFSPTGHLAFSARWKVTDKGGTYKLFEQGGNPTTFTPLVATETFDLYGVDYIQSPP